MKEPCSIIPNGSPKHPPIIIETTALIKNNKNNNNEFLTFKRLLIPYFLIKAPNIYKKKNKNGTQNSIPQRTSFFLISQQFKFHNTVYLIEFINSS